MTRSSTFERESIRCDITLTILFPSSWRAKRAVRKKVKECESEDLPADDNDGKGKRKSFAAYLKIGAYLRPPA